STTLNAQTRCETTLRAGRSRRNIHELAALHKLGDARVLEPRCDGFRSAHGCDSRSRLASGSISAFHTMEIHPALASSVRASQQRCLGQRGFVLLAAGVEDIHLVPLHRELNGLPQSDVCCLRPGEEQVLAGNIDDIATLD